MFPTDEEIEEQLRQLREIEDGDEHPDTQYSEYNNQVIGETMDILERIEILQGTLNKGEITINATCGADPIIALLGGIHARAAINKTRSGAFPHTALELEKVEDLIKLLKRE